MLKIFIKKFKRNLTDYGFLIAVKKMILFPFTDIYKKKDIYVYKKDLTKYEPVEKNNPTFKYVFFEKDNITESISNQLIGIEEWLFGKLDKILDNDGICLAAMDGDTVAGFNLVSFNEIYIPLVELKKKFRKNQAWSEQISVKKEYRKKGLGSILRYKMFNELKARGNKALYGSTMTDNISNIELSKKVGFEIFAKISFKRVFNSKKYKFEKVYPNQL